ncbi:uncharacterized protein LOC110233799 [Exaiptasia diaphana]|uniref:Teneurin-like YD-shell domain-containing protein n=1 Tax=Exaiptasia diaphana TaxID=2652724 RepID=A0A913WVK3_EXADI|nr:uncharacterized protein LOC110233799 [Exaiptasia diaphana]
MTKNGSALYYELDGEGSVIGLIDENGDIVNSYHYDPYGIILKAEERVRNDFLFVGQWGVVRDKAVPFLYKMRSRYYDAMVGRFISYDPLEYSTLETNLYVYAYNNPVVFTKKEGRIPIVPLAMLAVRAIPVVIRFVPKISSAIAPVLRYAGSKALRYGIRSKDPWYGVLGNVGGYA